MIEPALCLAREEQLAQLNHHLDKSVMGQGQICFLTGEAGAGKSTLIRAFAQKALEEHDDLLVSNTACDSETGLGDSYLPFREMLTGLSINANAQIAVSAISNQAKGIRGLLDKFTGILLKFGPDLIDLFIPGTALLTKVGTWAAEESGAAIKLKQRLDRSKRSISHDLKIHQDQIFEQFIHVVQALSKENPLLLVLDDLQWCDTASMALLFRIVRRLEGHAIFLVGTYRPAEVSLGRRGARHPLEKVVAEARRIFGDILIDLDLAWESKARVFIDALLDTEPNQLSDDFRQALFLHSSGQPLFTVETLRNMQERGDLVRNEEGAWIAHSNIDWHNLPARIEGVIEERLGRLSEDLSQTLAIASVEGVHFTAEVISKVRGIPAHELVRQLGGDLQKQHRLVVELGSKRVGERRVSKYRFHHRLFRQHLYHQLGETERAYLHEEIGFALEEIFGDEVEDAAPALAHHFENADVKDKTLHYLTKAGEQTARRYANEEAIHYFTRAFELTEASQTDKRFSLLMNRAKVYELLANRAAQRADLELLASLGQELGSSYQAETAVLHAAYEEQIGEYSASIEAAKQAVSWGLESGQQLLIIKGHRLQGIALWRMGRNSEAQAQLMLALDLAKKHSMEAEELTSLAGLGALANDLAEYTQARQFFEQALEIARETGNRRREGMILNNLGIMLRRQEKLSEAKRYYEEALSIFHEIGDRRGESTCLNNLGLIAKDEGAYIEARILYAQSLEINYALEDQARIGGTLNNLGIISQTLGNYREAAANYDRALEIARSIGNRRGEAIQKLNLGAMNNQRGEYQKAIEICDQTVELASELNSPFIEAHAYLQRGHALFKLGRSAQSIEAYTRANKLFSQTHQTKKEMEALAGLGRVFLAQDNMEKASQHLGEVINYLDDHADWSNPDFMEIYLIIHRFFSATQDPRKSEVLHSSRKIISDQASKIPDLETRRTFLENVPWNLEFESLQQEVKGDVDG